MKGMLAQVIGHFFVPNHIAPAHIRRIELETMRYHVEQPLAHEICLVASRAAVGADRSFVGEHAEHVGAIVFDPQRTAQHGGCGDRGHAAMGSRIAAHVEENLGIHRQDRSVVLTPIFTRWFCWRD